jgi:CheY-like chemotaxis protein
LHVVVKEALKLIRSSLPSTIEIREIIARDRDTVIADPTGMHQIVMNLCTNAYQAMRERGGTLEVALEVADLNRPLLATTGELDQGPYIRLDVRDTGMGIRTPMIERIFEPYFTTKPRGEGTGLGLAVVHGIVANHGGAIAVESEPGRGTTFSVYLPRVDRETVREVEPEAELPRGTEHVLFLDDEEALTQVGGQMLESLGYRVLTMSDSVGALQAFRDDPQQFDLVVTDQTMPGLTGADRAVELMTIRPDVPVVLCTGFSELIGPEKAHELGIRGFIKKPFTRGQLAKAVREALPNAPN